MDAGGVLVSARSSPAASLPLFICCVFFLWSAIHVQLNRWEAVGGGRRLGGSAPRLALEPAAQQPARAGRGAQGQRAGGAARGRAPSSQQPAKKGGAGPRREAPLLLRPLLWTARTLTSPLGLLLAVRRRAPTRPLSRARRLAAPRRMWRATSGGGRRLGAWAGGCWHGRAAGRSLSRQAPRLHTLSPA